MEIAFDCECSSGMERFPWEKKLLRADMGRYMLLVADYKASDFRCWVLIS